MKRYRFTLRPLTAVHIGTGDVVSPLEFCLLPSASGEKVYAVFSPEKAIEALSPQDKNAFIQFCDANNPVNLRKFLREKVRQPAVRYICKVSKEFESQYEIRKDDPNNALEVEMMYRNGKYAPVIPGSSIKGAIRTAILNQRINFANEEYFREVVEKASRSRFDKEFQNKVLSCIAPNDDPLRALAIGDLTFSPKGSQLVSNMIMYHLSSGHNDPFSNKAAIYAEVLKGELVDGNPIEAFCDLILHDELNASFVPQSSKALKGKIGQKLYKKPILIEEILKACDNFYNNAFNSEYNKIIKSSDEVVKQGADALADRIDSMQKTGEHLIRIGRWSHVESVTVEKYRKPKTNRGYGRTRTLFQSNDNYFLMGWCAFSVDEA